MLWLAATPIGNIGDASPRLRELLAGADTIAAEDTRRTGLLLQRLEISREKENGSRIQLTPLHDHNEGEQAAALAAQAATSEVVLVSDAGMPTVSDPGYRVVQEAIRQDVAISVVPGPSAVLAALALAGLPTDRFCFEGFVPRKQGERRKFLQNLLGEKRTIVCFEAPTRIASTLEVAAEILGESRQAAVCRELTKLHEEVRRGSLAELATWAHSGVRGEIVLVIGGAESHPVGAADADSQTASPLVRISNLVTQGMRLKDACKLLAQECGLSAKELYNAALAMRKEAEE